MTSTLQSRNRVQATLTTTMRLALEVLAERNGIGVSTQATILLRQALDRTIESAEVQKRYKQHMIQRTHAGWQYDQTTDYAVECAVKAHGETQ